MISLGTARNYNIKLTGEANSVAISMFPDEFKAIVVAQGYKVHQVFNGDKTGLFWKCILCITYITNEAKTAPGFKVAKDKTNSATAWQCPE